MESGYDHYSGTLERYFTDLRACDRMDPEQEALEARRMREGDREAARRLVEANLGFVVKIAFEYRNLGLPVGDLVNEGNLGLLRAAQRFEPERGVKFISYAVWWIRKAVVEALASQSGPVRVPARQLRGIWNAHREGGLPVPVPISLEIDGDRGEVGELSSRKDMEECLLREERRRGVKEALGSLEPRHRYVLEQRFGLGGGKRRTLRELAVELGVSTEWVRRIELKAKEHLRRILRGRGIPPHAGPGRPCRVH